MILMQAKKNHYLALEISTFSGPKWNSLNSSMPSYWGRGYLMVIGTKVADFSTFFKLDLYSNPYHYEPKDVFCTKMAIFTVTL
jgi:hypothetical protein